MISHTHLLSSKSFSMIVAVSLGELVLALNNELQFIETFRNAYFSKEKTFAHVLIFCDVA